MRAVVDGVKLPRLSENVLLLPADVTNPHHLKINTNMFITNVTQSDKCLFVYQ